MKRFDDAQDNIRIMASRTFVKFFGSVGRWQSTVKDLRTASPEANTILDEKAEGGYREIRLDTVHWETMIKGITIHLDDMNTIVQVCYY